MVRKKLFETYCTLIQYYREKLDQQQSYSVVLHREDFKIMEELAKELKNPNKLIRTALSVCHGMSVSKDQDLSVIIRDTLVNAGIYTEKMSNFLYKTEFFGGERILHIIPKTSEVGEQEYIQNFYVQSYKWED